ncbi:uncharacterized protein LOC126688363 [Mercurialis annua]|uniref:uncharacterized protein LOC126688363 n=1 Tax=Mercurialis annua TaxID=3986 RepID=UPI00215F855B|nr:uncharacterized protein LOC126688363 [Mercurialis annua]
MLKRIKLIRHALELMVLSEQWMQYRADDQGKARFVRDLILDENWWVKLNYIISFTGPIYKMIRVCDTNKPCLHLVYEMWDSMIQKVKMLIHEHENIQPTDSSSFYLVVHSILVDRWAKSNTPLHCLAHSLNPKYYCDKWLKEGQNRTPPHMDAEVSVERVKGFKRLFSSEEDRTIAIDEFANFSLKSGPFGDPDSIGSRSNMEPIKLWASYGSHAPLLQRLAFKVLGQPTSSSCSERNWSTYSFIHPVIRNKLNPKRAEDLVFIHNNLRLLSRNSSVYNDEITKIWDVGGDEFGSMEDVGVL